VNHLSRTSYDDRGLNVILGNNDTEEVLEQITNEEGFKNFGYILDTKEDFMNLLEELGFESYYDFDYCMRHSKITDNIRP
jgi:hypothetical protein